MLPPGPSLEDPIRQERSLKPIFHAADKAGQSRAAHAKVAARLDAWVEARMREAAAVFFQPRGADDAAMIAARDLMARWVMRPGAPLVLGRERVEPAPALVLMQMRAHCMAGDEQAAIGLGLGADRGSEVGVAAAILLAASGREDEARVFLAPEGAGERERGGADGARDGGGFWESLLRGRLAQGAAERAHYIERARRLAEGGAERRALALAEGARGEGAEDGKDEKDGQR